MLTQQQNNIIATLTHDTSPSVHTSPDAVSLNTLDHGHILTNQLQNQGLTFSATHHNPGPNLLVAFDSNSRQTSNPRLEGPNSFDRKKWIGGNIPTNQNLGTLLILQEHGYDADGTISTWPEAHDTSPSGFITLNFTTPATAFGFDILGCEGPQAPTPHTATPNTPGLDFNFAIQFFAGDQSLATIGFSEFINPNSPHFNADNPLQFGQRAANRIHPIQAQTLGADSFDRADIHLGGPAAIGSLVVQNGAPAPSNFKFPG